MVDAAPTLMRTPGRFTWAPPEGGPKTKLAAMVADRIIADVVARKWPVGDVLGSEAELLKRYGVSRAVFREAVRLLENQQVARMRRGPGGGLVVTEPTVGAIIDAAVLYLYRVGARLDEVFEARLVLEELVVQIAPSRLRDEDIHDLRELAVGESQGTVLDHRAMHSMLAAATHNLALELFVDILNRVSLLYFADRKMLTSRNVAEASHAHARIAESVIDGNEALARRRMRKHLEAEAQFLRGRRSARQVLDPVTAIKGASGGKRAEEVAQGIFRNVFSGYLGPGELIGSEPELMERFGVSRAIIREAVRLLEHHHIAAMRRGPGGGLFVSAPNVAAVTDVVALYLERHGITVRDVFEVRVGVELALVDPVINGMDESGEVRLRDALKNEATASEEGFTEADFAEAAHDVHAVIASMSGNRVLEFLTVVLIRLVQLHQTPSSADAARRELVSGLAGVHRGIAEALIAKDRQLARRRMQRHLDALPIFFH